MFVPFLILFIGILFLSSGKRCTAAFLRGAKEGLYGCASLFPTLLLFVCAISLLRASGAIDLMTAGLSTVCEVLHIPPALLPLMLTRPISGSASTAVLSDILSSCGPDSAIGMTASVLCGASETVFYVLSVYTDGTPLSGMRHLLPAAILTTLFVAVLSLVVCRFLFGI